MKKLFLFFLLTFLTAVLPAQELNFTSQNIPQEASFAQPFDVRFELSHTPGYQVSLDKNSLPADFKLTSEQLENLSPGTASYQLTFLPFTLGVSTFTAVNIQLLNSNGEIVARAASDTKQVKVNPVQFFKDKDMRDIRPPYIPTSWIWWLLCALVLAALIWLAWRFWHKVRENQAQAKEVQDNRPADVIALSKIQLLLQSGLWEKAQYKTFYIELGEILREYLWRRYQLDVSADTSSELLRRLRTQPQLKPLLQSLREYLSSSDLVKFAKVIPTQSTMQQDVTTVEHLVRATTPRPQTHEQQEEN